MVEKAMLEGTNSQMSILAQGYLCTFVILKKSDDKNEKQQK